MRHKLLFTFITLLSTTLLSCSSDDGDTPKIVEKTNVTGNIEKGPFVQGSKMTLYELEENLSQTGKTFKTQTNSDLGAFTFDTPIELKSQYVELETSGYFYNEVKGELSSSQITLNALSNVASRNAVNVNLITHLEYGRVKKLVRDGVDFNAAKKQAERELLACFAIKDEISTPEGVSITDNNRSSAILLAISTIMLYERSEAEFTEFISKFSTDFADNGQIDNSIIREEIKKGQENAHPSKVIERMKEFYANKGVNLQCDDFSPYIDFNGDGVINEDDGENLDVTPPDVVVVDEFWNDANSVRAILNGCYASLQKFTNAQLQLEYIRTKKAEESAPWWSESLSSISITPNSSLVSTTYTNAYTTVNYLNMLIDHADYLNQYSDRFEDGEVQSIIAQTIGLRAFLYYNVAMLWGNVVLVTKTYNDIEERLNLVQSSQTEVYDFVKKEVTKAIPMLSNDYGMDLKNKCFFTKDDAYMLLAEVNLAMKNSSEALNALSHIDASKYNASIDDVSPIYNGNIENVKAVIFALSLEGHYQPVYTHGHYAMLSDEAKGSINELATRWEDAKCAEYGYWAALKRLSFAQSVTGCQDYELLMPIPLSELYTNNKITQNPGY